MRSNIDFANYYKNICKKIIPCLDKNIKYIFMDGIEYIKKSTDKIELQYIYWYEIFERIHILCISGLLRSYYWLDIYLNGYYKKNLFEYSSGLRGLIESAADLFYSFNGIPLTIIENYSKISLILQKKEVQELIICKNLEDRLIHYTHGRRVNKSEDAPTEHYAKSNKEYITNINPGGDKIYNLYSDLCQIVHPAAYSISIFFEMFDDFMTYQDNSYQKILEIEDKAKNEIKLIYNLSFNTVLIGFDLINKTALKTLHLEIINNLDLTKIGDWNKLRKKLKI